MLQADFHTVGRLAPSPTGLLHLGNIWSFLSAWLFCRSRKGRLLLRIEDIDPARSRGAYVDACVEDLQWLGIDWDAGDAGAAGVSNDLWYTQSMRRDVYEHALLTLQTLGYTYPCFCTRKELKAMAGAPHCEDDAVVYAGTCRNLTPEEQAERFAGGAHASIRIRCGDGADVRFTDGLYGEQHYTNTDWGGDFPLMRSDGVFAYQLAVALDDSLMGVTQVVRGRDLLVSTARQLYLLRLLHMPAPREYIHLPLLLDEAGERLAKRHKSLTIQALRKEGRAPERIIGFLAYLMGLNPQKKALSAEELLQCFSPQWFPRKDIRIANALLEQAF